MMFVMRRTGWIQYTQRSHTLWEFSQTDKSDKGVKKAIMLVERNHYTKRCEAGRHLWCLLAHATGAGRRLWRLLAMRPGLVGTFGACSPMQPGVRREGNIPSA